MSNARTNMAAWLTKVGDKLEVRTASYPSPKEHEVIIKTCAWAINFIDWKLQTILMFNWFKFPLISGGDIAGEVTEVGSGVTNVKRGDRVLGFASWSSNKPREGGLQDYIAVPSIVATPIPDLVPYSEAVYPSVPARPDTGKTVLVWGGSSAVRCNAIQLAVAAGYRVVTTASPGNFDYLKKLGASTLLDYKSSTIVDNVVSIIKASDFAGIFQASGSMNAVLQIASRLSKDTDSQAFIATSVVVPEKKPDGVEAKMVWTSTLKNNETGRVIFQEFLPKALAQKSFVPAPTPWVIGHGLESIQEGCDVLKKGISAKKVAIVRSES